MSTTIIVLRVMYNYDMIMFNYLSNKQTDISVEIKQLTDVKLCELEPLGVMVNV